MACFKTAVATNCCSAFLDFVSAYNKEWIWSYWSRWHEWESLSLGLTISKYLAITILQDELSGV